MTRKSQCYRAFGLVWQSALPLPELRSAADGGEPDVVVVLDAAPPPDLPELVADVRADARSFWMEVPGVARFLVEDGCRLAVELLPGSEAGDVRAFLLGSAVGALLHQRGVLPLHASAVEVGGRAIAFVAPSGGGKSTMAMHLHHLGCRVIADDICAIEVGNGTARLWPGLRNLKLWRASLAAIDQGPGECEPVLATIDKYRVPATALAEYRAFELAAVIELDWGAVPALDPVPGAAAVGALVAHTFRGQLVAAMGREAAHWRQCLDLFGAAGHFRLTRPRALDRLDASSALILDRFAVNRPTIDD